MAKKHSQIRNIQLFVVTMIGSIKVSTQALLITVPNLSNLQYNLNLSEII